MKYERKFLLVMAILTIFLMSCATPGGPPELTQTQQDALCKLTGNALAETIRLARPELMIPARTFCDGFLQAQNLIEAEALLNNTLSYLSGKYVGNQRLANIIMNALIVIGLDKEQAKKIVTAKIDEIVRIEGFTEEMWHRAQLIVQGFCEMT